LKKIQIGVFTFSIRGFKKTLRGIQTRIKKSNQSHKKSIGLIQFVSDLFSLRIGTFILSATTFQSLVEVLNCIFTRLFFFLYIATERKPYAQEKYLEETNHNKEPIAYSIKFLYESPIKKIIIK
jgi:hypothetical protein